MSDDEFDEHTGEEIEQPGSVYLPLTADTDLPQDFTRWVDTTLLGSLTAARHLEKRVWCDRWAEHPDVLHRLFAMWVEWQDVQARTSSLHDFIRNVLDYHMPYLVGEYGSLRRCGHGHKPHVRLDEAD